MSAVGKDALLAVSESCEIKTKAGARESGSARTLWPGSCYPFYIGVCCEVSQHFKNIYIFPAEALQRSSLCLSRAGEPWPWSRTVGGEQEIGCILLWEPSYFIDLLFYLQTLQVIELWLVALESAVNIVFSPAVGLVFALQEGG